NETNETFFVNLSSPVNANLSRIQAVGTIVNDDTLAAIASAGATLAAESCLPANGAIDPNESVTVNFLLRNVSAGTANTTTLTATLLQAGGVISPGAAHNYGALTPNGAAVSRPFTFTANGVCGDTMVAVLQLQDGGNSLGRVTNFLALGKSGAATNTFSNNNPITILDNSPADIYPSTIAVSGLGPATTRVTATLTGLGHSYPADMDILLVGPLGQKVLLMSDAVGGNSFSGLNLTFADSAPSGLPFSTPITSGTYKPTDWTDFGPPDTFPAPAPSGPYGTNLSILNGTDPNGTWSLYIVDDTGGDSGNLTGGWSLTIAATTPAICCGPDSSADLAVSMTASQPSIPIGSNVTFTVTLTNLG